MNIHFEIFRSKLSVCAKHNHWSDEDQLAHLQASLVKDAAQCLWDVGSDKVPNLSGLLELMQLRFGSCIVNGTSE
jgi:hypothetical protein